MSEMEDKLNTLTPDELNALNTDPELLNAFKEKYGTHGHDTLMQTVQGAYQKYKQSPLYQASPQGMLNTAADLVHKGADVAGQKVTEAMGGSGIPGVSNPNVAAGVGTAIQMAPDIATSFMGGGAAQDAAKAGELGMAGRVISGPARAEAGQAVGAAEQAAGVHPDIIPTIKDVTANLGLKNASAKQYLNALMERLKSDEPMSAESLSQHHKMISDLLSQEPQGFGKMVSGSKLGEPAVAQAAKADSMLVQRLNEEAPGRADAAADYAAAKMRGNIYKGIAGAGAAYAGRNVILDAFKRVAGGK